MAAKIAFQSFKDPPKIWAKNHPLYHPTYFSIIIEYFHIKFIFSTIVLLSKHHLKFLNRHENKKVIQRLISSQIGSIFKLSASFRRYYFNFSNPYTLITKFYTDFGFIQHISFPQHHTRIMQPCLTWKRGNKSIDWSNIEIIETDDFYYNPYDWQYNAIQYNRIPFDFVILMKLQKAELLIHWLDFILKQDSIHCDYDLYRISLNTPSVAAYDDEVLNWKCDVLMITAINDYSKVSGGYPLYLYIIRNICEWPSREFEKVIDFIVPHLGTVCFEGFLCDSLRDFCAAKDLQLGCHNYASYLSAWSKHKLMTNQNKYLSKNIIHAINIDVWRWNLYRTIFDIICHQNEETQDVLQAAKRNTYYQCMFGGVGAFLRDYVDPNDLKRYLQNVAFNVDLEHKVVNVDSDKYTILFLELLGFPSDE